MHISLQADDLFWIALCAYLLLRFGPEEIRHIRHSWRNLRAEWRAWRSESSSQRAPQSTATPTPRATSKPDER